MLNLGPERSKEEAEALFAPLEETVFGPRTLGSARGPGAGGPSWNADWTCDCAGLLSSPDTNLRQLQTFRKVSSQTPGRSAPEPLSVNLGHRLNMSRKTAEAAARPRKRHTLLPGRGSSEHWSSLSCSFSFPTQSGQKTPIRTVRGWWP